MSGGQLSGGQMSAFVLKKVCVSGEKLSDEQLCLEQVSGGQLCLEQVSDGQLCLEQVSDGQLSGGQPVSYTHLTLPTMAVV